MSGWRDERGFSLAELLVAFAVLALVLAAATTIQRSVLQAYVVGSNQTEAQQNARAALERIARELRQARAALTAPTATSLTLLDQDTGVAVTYALTGDAPNATLTRTTGGVADVVIGRVETLTFAYCCEDNGDMLGVPPDPAKARRVDITIRTASEDTVVAGGIADTRTQITTSVQLRNL